MNLSQREDVKFKISKLKDWKRLSKFLKETKEELLDKRKGISYSPEMPGYHSTIFQEYNKLLEKTEDYDKCIEVYDTYIHILERAMNDLLDEKHKEVIDIYINNASDKLRVSKAIENGYSQAIFYKLLNESLDIIALAIAPTKEKIKRMLE